MVTLRWLGRKSRLMRLTRTRWAPLATLWVLSYQTELFYYYLAPRLEKRMYDSGGQSKDSIFARFSSSPMHAT